MARKTMVSDIFDININRKIYAIMLDAEIFEKGGLIKLDGFDFFLKNQDKDLLTNMDEYRRHGKIIEGGKIFPNEFIGLLEYIGGGEGVKIKKIFIEDVEQFYVKIEEINQFIRDEIYDELLISDAGSHWDIRFRDDDPLIFFSALSEYHEEILTSLKSKVVEISDDFVYAY